MEFENYLIEQLKLHPSMQPQDIVKMCYQAAYGAEHLLKNIESVRVYLEKEYKGVMAEEGVLFEHISDNVCRVNLAAWKAKGFPLEWLFKMFVLSSKINQNSDSLFFDYLQTAEKVLCQIDVSFSLKEWEDYILKYKKNGITPVHHSEQYRKHERPAYRIIDSRFCRIFPILEKVEKFVNNEKVCIIAIDGRAASGKTTLANDLKMILDADVIQMDDFFLPPSLRTEKRLREPGGNIHYERFIEEVIPFISERCEFAYQIFDCSKMNFNGMREIGKKQFRIVEGSYSCHPILGTYADITVFSDVSADIQIERIRKRNGETMLKLFRDKWIPWEEDYFEFYQIRQKTDIHL